MKPEEYVPRNFSEACTVIGYLIRKHLKYQSHSKIKYVSFPSSKMVNVTIKLMTLPPFETVRVFKLSASEAEILAEISRINELCRQLNLVCIHQGNIGE